MRLAVIGDIHSNIAAFEGVLKDIEKRNVDCILGTGDLVGYLPYPNEVIDLLRKKKILCVQGNHDLKIAEGQPLPEEILVTLEQEKLQAKASEIYTNLRITKENRSYLKNMPKSISLLIHGKRLLIVHGSPKSQNEYLYHEESLLLEQSKDVEYDVIICGHTHQPYKAEVNHVTFINAGSVGKPKHGNGNATYVILQIEEDAMDSEIVEVDYNKKELIDRIKKESMISDTLIEMLEKGY